jgi:uncharacterized membrane protein YgaE (UPF0421/DUF939 family)
VALKGVSCSYDYLDIHLNFISRVLQAAQVTTMSIFIRFFHTLLFVSLSLVGNAYMIDDTCTGQDLQNVQDAAAEAVNMYAYANFRVTRNDPRLDFGAGRVFDQLLSTNQRARFLRKRSYICSEKWSE